MNQSFEGPGPGTGRNTEELTTEKLATGPHKTASSRIQNARNCCVYSGVCVDPWPTPIHIQYRSSIWRVCSVQKYHTSSDDDRDNLDNSDLFSLAVVHRRAKGVRGGLGRKILLVGYQPTICCDVIIPVSWCCRVFMVGIVSGSSRNREF